VAKEHLATLAKLGPDAEPAVPSMIRPLDDDNLQDEPPRRARRFIALSHAYWSVTTGAIRRWDR
jgi:hypothetical protein